MGFLQLSVFNIHVRLNSLGCRTPTTHNSCSNLSTCSSKGLLCNFALKVRDVLYSIVKSHNVTSVYVQTLMLTSFLRELLCCCCLWLAVCRISLFCMCVV